MQIQLSDDPFRLWIRREESQELKLTVRFEAEHGMGMLGLRVQGRTDPAPTSHYEEMAIDNDVLRGGRFVHILPNGPRRSYALSRITTEIVSALPTDKWIELEPITEYGFRYLVFPKDLPVEEPVKAEVATATRPAPVAKASTGGIPKRSTLPARQTPVAPELAHEALAKLSPKAAIQHLKMEMAKVAALHKRIDELERQITNSRTREQDLLAVLQKWQSID